MLRSVLYARQNCVHTKDTNLVQLDSADCFTVFLILTPKIFISSL